MRERDRQRGRPRDDRGADETARPATGTGGSPGGGTGGSPGARPAAPRPGGDAPGGARGKLSWIALAVAVVLTAWQVIYAITVQGMNEANIEVYTSVWLLISLVFAVGSAVLGIVAVSQRSQQRWPAIAALSIGVYVFLVCIATWTGELLAATG